MMRNKGYTLVEIAIVIVIIGLLIGGVIKGESLIQSAKVSGAITLAQDISVAVGTFKQRYHMLPGDILIDATTPEISVRAECWTGGKKGNNNGQIEATESDCVAEELFQAGMAKVEQDNGVPVFKSAYGVVAVKAASLSEVTIARGVNPFAASITHVVEFANLPCAVVQEIDRKIDNDDIKTGKGIASVDACPADDIMPFYAVAL